VIQEVNQYTMGWIVFRLSDARSVFEEITQRRLETLITRAGAGPRMAASPVVTMALTTSSLNAIINCVVLTNRRMRTRMSGGVRIDPNANEFSRACAALHLPPVTTPFARPTSHLALLLGNLTSVARLSRLPSIKEMARAARMDDETMPFGLLGYPVLQAADILLPRAHLVPVGKDNQAHVEITREIARRFNFLYGEVFPEPGDLVQGDTLPGTDGQNKMSKSLGNAIFLSDDPSTVRKKVHSMYTDPKRIRADIPGTVEGNPVFTYLDYFDTDPATLPELKDRYRSGTVGDVEVKERLTGSLNAFLAPVRERMSHYSSQSGLVDEIIFEGTTRYREVAGTTLRDVKKAMGVAGTFNRIARKAEERQKKLARAAGAA
jgi:tryptophanyl-tRNA synthetase